MQQFKSHLPFQQDDEADIPDEVDILEEDPSIEVVPVVISTTPAPLLLQTNPHPVMTTEPLRIPSARPPERYRAVATEPLPVPSVPPTVTELLRVPSGTLPIIATTPSLNAALQATTTSRNTERVVVIPGPAKHKRPEPKTTTPARRMSPRLRQGIALATLLLVIIVSLVTLSPLANGQYAFPIFQNISNWFQSQQQGWQLQGHRGSNAPVLPPMSFPNSQYIAIAQQDAINAGIPSIYFVRQIAQESAFNSNAVSPAGEVGIAQFLPSTAAQHGINPWDPIQALQGAAKMMASYASQYGGDYAKALAAYNAGTGTVQNAVNNCGANWLNCIPGQTRNYIFKIMGI